MPRSSDLEYLIRVSSRLIVEYEENVALSADPKEKARAAKAIAEQRELIKGYVAEYIQLRKRVRGAVPGDIAELAASQESQESQDMQEMQLRTTPIDNLPASMALNSEQTRVLHSALLDAFTVDTLRQLTSLYLGVRLDTVAGGDELSTTVFNLIKWSQRNGCEMQLVQAALSAVPGNRKLQAFATTISHSS